MRFTQSVKAAFAVLSAALILGGLCLLIWPGASVSVLCAALGVLSVLYGAVRLAGYFSNDLYRLAFQFDLAVGILSILIGLLLILRTDRVLANLALVVGVFLLVDSVLRLQTALDARHFGMRRWWLVLLASVCGAALSLLLLLRPLDSALALTRLTGAALLLDGAENLLACLYTVRVPRRAAPDIIDTTCTVEGPAPDPAQTKSR